MLKTSDGKIALVALVALAAWLLIVLPIIYTPSAFDLREWLTHDAAGFFTLCLVIVALGQASLFVWQLRYMRKAMSDAANAAKAAESTASATQDSVALARDEFNSVHRPKMRLKHLWLTTHIWEGERVQTTAVFVNAGLAPATLRELNIGTCIIHSEKMLPENPNWIKNQTFQLSAQPPLGGGISLEIKDLNDGRILKDLENVAIREGKARLYFAGAIEYQDQRGLIRKTAFCRVLRLPDSSNPADRGRFLRVDDSDYEYED